MDDSVSNSETSPLLNCSGEHSDGSAVLNNCSDANIKMEVCGWEYGGVLTEPDSSKEGGESCRVVDDVFMEKMIDEQSSITETWCQEECHDCPQHQPYHGAIEVEALNQENETRREEILPTELGEPVAIEGNLHCEDPEGHVQDFADDTSSIERNENSVLNESRQDYYHEDPASSKMPLVGVQKMPSPEDNLRQQDTNKCLEDSCNLSLKNRLIHLRKLVTDDSDNAPHTNTADSNQKLETQLKNIVRIWRRKVFCSKWPLAKNSSTGYPCPCLLSKCQPECPGASSNEVCQASCNIRTKARCGARAEASNLSSDVDTGLARKAGPLEGSVLDRGEKEGKKDLLKVPDSFCGEAHMQDVMAHEVELHMDSEDISISNKRDGSIFVRSIPDGLGDDSYKIVVVCDGDESEDCSEQTSTSDQSIVAEVKKTSPVTAEMPGCSVENAEEASNRTSPLVKDDVTGMTNAEICDFLGISSQEGQLPGFEVAETYKKTKYVKNTGPDASFSDEKIVCTITSDKPLENRVFITCTSPKPGEAVGQSGTIPELLVRVRLANKASSSVSRTSGVIMPERHVETRTVDAERLRGCGIEEQPSSCELSPVEIDGLADSYGCTDLSSVLEPVGDLLVIIFWVCLATTVILYELAWYPLDLE
ncbi:hypothetical protein EGW08_018352 [Elysia chlorotica]|uniref:Uncharacterized protein n=1 Tax=Elysia chlorotica TaxID=188477 RepID=A0A433SX77_ELYCH|nr:hypothetical protein EGW08_018352 [Elysia chlorotica]